MIVYYTTTYYHVLCAIVHKLMEKKSQEAYIIVSDSRSYHQSMCERLAETDIFAKVIYQEDRVLVKKCSNLYRLQGCRGSIGNIEKMLCKEIETSMPFVITDENEYYVMSDFKPFGLYLIKNNIAYNYFEDAAGVLSREHMLLNVLGSPWTRRVIAEYHLNGSNDLVIKKYADLSVQEEGFYDEKAVDFRVRELIEALDEVYTDNIIYIFGANKLKSTEKNRAIILTQAYMMRKNFSFARQRRTYALLMDYYCEDMDICIKPHPMDFHATYARWFPDAEVINPQIPAEVLGLCIDDGFEVGVSISSTAIYSISQYVNDIICFDTDMDNKIDSIHQYYVLMRILERINRSKFVIYTSAFHHQFFKDMLQRKSDLNSDKIEMNHIIFPEEEEEPKRNFFFWRRRKLNGNSNYRVNPEVAQDPRKKIYIFNSVEVPAAILECISEDDIVISVNKVFGGIQKLGINSSRFVKLEIANKSKMVNGAKMGGFFVYSKDTAEINDVCNIAEVKELIHSQLNLKIDGYHTVPEEAKDIIIELLKKECSKLKEEYK